MKFSFSGFFASRKKHEAFTILLATAQPTLALLEALPNQESIHLKEAFTTTGVIQSLNQVNLVILGDVLPTPDLSLEVLNQTLETSGVPVVSTEIFLDQPEEWLARARLASTRKVTILPPRQINLVNWSGGVGKTTLAMAICKRSLNVPACRQLCWS